MQVLCSFKGCFGKVLSKGLCGAHYQHQRQGKELAPLQKQYHGLSERDRFFKRVGKLDSGCWVWLGSLNTGYGQFRTNEGRIILAHRFSFLLHNDTAIDGLVVMHKCDNPKCVNPEHLALGTQADNVLDMQLKGREKKRGSPGEAHGMSKLNDESVRRIRAATGSIAAIAKEHGVSRAVIYDVRERRTWKHIE